jgi:hypothetical protein
MIPENILSLGVREAQLRAQSLDHIERTPELLDHLAVVEAAMTALMDHVHERPVRHPDELPLKGLGIRLFNDLGAGLGDVLSGYYQQAVATVRDALEIQLLLDDFSDDTTKLHRWATASKRDREKEFGPRAVRERLDARYGHTEQRRRAVYQRFSTLAAHPSPEGFRMLAPDGLAIIGPFFEPGRLKAVLEEMAQHGLAATVNFTTLLPAETAEERHAKKVFVERGAAWLEKYMGREVAQAVAAAGKD